MNIFDELLLIRDINQIDLAIAHARQTLRDGVDRVKQTTAAVVSARDALEAAEAHLTASKRAESALSRRVQELTAQRNRTRQLIDAGQATDYEKATLQLQQQNDLLDETETNYLEQIEEREQAEIQQTAATTALEQARQQDTVARSDYKQMAPGLKADIAAQTAKRPAILDDIEPSRRRQYLDLQGRGMDALSFIVNGACSHCFMNTPPQVINEVDSQRRIHCCRGCGRFFFASREETD